MPQSPFSRDALYGVRKPGPSFKTTIDRASPLAGGLSTVLLFDGPKLTDVAITSRTVSRRGTLVLSRGLRGGQARSVITASSGALYSPCLTLNPTTNAPSGFTLSARVQFDGTNPSAGSLGSIGAALAADDSGRMPVFISPVSGSFRTRVSAENEFLSSGANLVASSLSGWHRVTVTVSGSLATLYVDGGATFVGSATQAMANWNLRAVLGSDITSGVQWNWQTADVFFWTRALSADEVLAHATRPYASLKSALAERFVAAVLPETAVDLTNPWDLPFTDDFGPQIAPGVLSQMSGQASFSADASSIVHSNFITASAVLGGAAFMQAEAGVRKTASASFPATSSLTANALPPGLMFIGNGSGNLVSNASIVRTGVATMSGSSGIAAAPGVRYSVRAAFQGAGGISEPRLTSLAQVACLLAAWLDAQDKQH
jgi:concanavalin A-like lectin/glucanase superfamily protein